MTNESVKERFAGLIDLPDAKMIEVQRNSIYTLTAEVETVKH